MFTSNGLPPPPSHFNQERHVVRLESDPTRPQPQGECHHHNSNGQHQRCPCQIYQYNRNALGNVCDCGHPACYHSPTRTEPRVSSDRVTNALVEKVRRLEEIVIQEREHRSALLTRERMTWEKEIQALREALSPFYRSENDMQRKITDVEHRLDLITTEHVRVKDKVSAVVGTYNTIEHHGDLRRPSKPMKRKASVGPETDGVMSPDSSYVYSSSESDTTSASIHKASQPPSPPMRNTLSPRSSGMLYLRPDDGSSHNRHLRQAHRLPSPSEEPRSSGFLSIDLAERLRHQTLDISSRRKVVALDSDSNISKGPLRSGLPSPPQQKVSSGALAVSELLSYDCSPKQFSRSPKKIKHQPTTMTGLELLASAATPLAQRA